MLKFLRNLFAPAQSRDVIGERESLYTRCFGCSSNIYHSTDRVFPHVDVYHFEPTDSRPYHTLITGGMAEYRQPIEVEPTRIELMLYVKSFELWTVNLIKMLAEYPAQNDSFFMAFHTVPIGYRLTDTAEISAFLLAPAESDDSEQLQFYVDGEEVDYLVCVPITMIEHAFAREVSSKKLYEKLQLANLLIHADDERKSIVDYTPQETD